jgi:Family of unknown function (DUF6328)
VRWNDGARAETETERLERNWPSLLQELRVAQTGVQLTGFLPTLPFQQRFDRLDDAMRHALVAVSASAYGVGFGWAPAGVPDGIQAAAAD